LTRLEPNVLKEYDVTQDEVDRACNKTIREIDQERKAGKLKPWKK